MLVYYFTSIDNALFTRQSWQTWCRTFSYLTHVEDVVLISVLRGLAVLLAYVLGTGRFYQRYEEGGGYGYDGGGCGCMYVCQGPCMGMQCT